MERVKRKRAAEVTANLSQPSCMDRSCSTWRARKAAEHLLGSQFGAGRCERLPLLLPGRDFGPI